MELSEWTNNFLPYPLELEFKGNAKGFYINSSMNTIKNNLALNRVFNINQIKKKIYFKL